MHDTKWQGDADHAQQTEHQVKDSAACIRHPADHFSVC